MSCNGNDELGIDNVLNVGDSVGKSFGCNEAEEVVAAGGFAQSDIQLAHGKIAK